MNTQNKIILKHLKEVGPISALDAVYRYRITRLSARIFDLRQAGYTIINLRVKPKNGKPYTEYILIEEEPCETR